MIHSHSIQPQIGICNDIDLINIKFQTDISKDGHDIVVNVWKPLFLQALVQIKVYGCKHIAKNVWKAIKNNWI